MFSLCFIIFMLLPLKKSLKKSHQLVRFFYFIFEYMVKEVRDGSIISKARHSSGSRSKCSRYLYHSQR
ncbi:hypothetical protein LEQ41_01135 [Streptococcus agalactiae]|nr:hypothetical protein [Streptococcus agalactiae]